MKQRNPLLSLLALARVVYGDALPYNPTRIFLHRNSSYAYVFGPSSQSATQAQLSTLDISSNFDSASPQLTIISKSLPFLQDGEQLPYTSSIDASGNITAIAGQCTPGSRDAQVWQFQPNSTSQSGQGEWSQYETMYTTAGDNADYSAPGYLSNSITFSDGIDGDSESSSIYVFSGMCPFANSTDDTWMSRADYSNSMLTMSPGTSNFDISLTSNSQLPISQAGSSITALPPTYGMNTSGLAQTQQQTFVLLGGNTQTAFINTSQVALFSLPQRSWSFMDALQPTDDKTDLTMKRAVEEVTPRSGHTAVLSEGGNSIIVFGGWVGNVNTPAQPQLAVLELGDGYGGIGDWKWTVPNQPDDGLASGSGIYGHGAIMLPGGVMMVLGGYEISASSSQHTKRATQPVNSQVFLYNSTSNSWLKSYTNPASVTGQSHEGAGPLNTTSEKVGLGTGLGIGAALLVTVIGCYIWYSKRLKKAEDDRERALMTYSSDGSAAGHIEQPFLASGANGSGPDEGSIGRFWASTGMGDGAYPRPPQMQHATGAFVNIPSPTRGLRKGSVNRNYQYHAAPRYDDNRLSRGSRNIHPIAEDENEDDHKYLAEDQTQAGLSNAERGLQEVERVLNSNDPFVDPEISPLRSHPVSPIEGDTVRRVPTNASEATVPKRRPLSGGMDTAANWTAAPEPKELLMEEQDAGFSWVNGDDRTSSTLSERSQYSTASSGSITRTMSSKTATKTGAMLFAAAAAAHRAAGGEQISPTRERSNTASTNASYKSTYFRPRATSFGNGPMPTSPGEDGESFVSARSNFRPYHTESDGLLQARTAAGDDDPYSRALAVHQSMRNRAQQIVYPTGPPPPVPPRRRPGLMGSLRRAFNAVSMGDRSVSLTGTREQYEDGTRSTSSSPTKEYTNKGGPRRAVSDGGALLSHKRGQKDWNEKEWPPYRDDPNAPVNDWGEPLSSADMLQAEEDWDVEGAATNRDFQFLFTVPKSRLRVVNDDMDRASLKSASDGGLSRNGSLRREGSLKMPKLREKESARLSSTMEEETDDGEKGKIL